MTKTRPVKDTPTTHIRSSRACRWQQLKIINGVFNANAAWLTCAVIAYNLTRAAAALTKTTLGKARTATIRAVLANIPARIAHSGRVHTLHLPAGSLRETLFHKMFDAIMAPPRTA